jgi:hypothetical protein
MIQSFYFDGGRFIPSETATVNGKRVRRWAHWQLISGAYVLQCQRWLPLRAARRDVIDAVRSMV